MPCTGVIDDDRELVRVQAVRAPHDEVADVATEVLRLRALQAIAVFDARFARRGRATRAARAGAIRRDAVAAGPGIDALAAGSLRRALQLTSRACALVHVAGCAQPGEGSLVELGALGLPHDVAVPFEAVALERCEDRRFGVGPRPRQVDVLDAHQPLAAGGARVA